MQGVFITFEGLDFSGKTVQATRLREYLAGRGYRVLLLRDPGGTVVSERIREILLDNRLEHLSPTAELLLYSAARAQMVEEQIAPALRDGQVVICDRFYDSTTAYQGYGRGLDLGFIRQLNAFVARGCRPALTFLLDLSPEEALGRQKEQGKTLDRMDQQTLEFNLRVRDGYLEIVRGEPDRVILIDGNRPVDIIQSDIVRAAETRLST